MLFIYIFTSCFIKSVSKVEAMFKPDGKVVECLAERTPAGPSWKHKPLKPNLSIGGI